MPGLITDRDDARVARAWAAFAREDAAARPPAGLEARVLQAARTALAERRRAEAERQRRRWLAGTSAMAAGLLAAAVWCLSVLAPPPVAESPMAAPAPTAPTAGTTSAQAAAAATAATGATSAAAPMTNVEAGRMLATPPHALLASRPLFDPADTGPVGARSVPGARAYHAPVVEPAPYARTAAPARAGTPPRDVAEPLAPVVLTPDAWVTREITPIFDPETAQPVAPPAPLADQKTGATPREAPPLPKP